MLDEFRRTEIALDYANELVNPHVVLNCGDNEGRLITVTLTDGGAPVTGDYTARFLFNQEPRNKNSAGGYVTMEQVEGETLTFECCVPGKYLRPGHALCAVQISSGEQTVLTRTFTATVESAVIGQDSEEAQSGLSEFFEAIATIEDTKAEADKAIQEVTQIKEDVEKVIEEAEQAIAEVAQIKDDVDKAIEEADKAIEEITQVKEDVDKAIEEADKAIEEVSQVKEEAEQAIAEVAQAIEEITQVREDVENAIAVITQVRDEITQITQEVEYNIEATTYTYPGRDLTEVFADEIASYSDAWAWLQARTKAADFTGLRIADYIPVTLSTDESLNYCIGAIDPYYRCGDTAKGHHIAMVPNKVVTNCVGDYATGNGTVQWNTTATNNGTADDPHPYTASNLHKWELNDFYYQLPEEVRNVIMDQRMILEERYSESGSLTDPTTASWVDMGPVWSLSEMEVYGCAIRTQAFYGVGLDCQFPYFAQSKNRVISARYNTWLRSARSGNATTACYVNSSGSANSYTVTTEYRARPCFLIG